MVSYPPTLQRSSVRDILNPLPIPNPMIQAWTPATWTFTESESDHLVSIYGSCSPWSRCRFDGDSTEIRRRSMDFRWSGTLRPRGLQPGPGALPGLIWSLQDGPSIRSTPGSRRTTPDRFRIIAGNLRTLQGSPRTFSGGRGTSWKQRQITGNDTKISKIMKIDGNGSIWLEMS